jgi:AcrR family transcriptional regulator
MHPPDTAVDAGTDLTARRGYHHGNLRESLLEAARRLTAERGPHGFTLAEAARLAGVSASAPYRHFRDKDALLSELGHRGFVEFGQRMRDAAMAGGLVAMGPAYLRFAREEPGYYGVMFGWQQPKEGEVERSSSFSALVNAIARAFPASVDPERARLLGLQIWAMSHGVAGLERGGWPPASSGVPRPEEVLSMAVSNLIRAG